MTTQRVPAVEGLFSEGEGGARLLGSRCAACGTPYFPRTALCHHPDCDGSQSQMEDATFGPRGTLWSCAVQNYPPPPPARYDEPYTPYAIGAVDLPEGLRVVGRLAVEDPQSVPVGAEVELILAPLYRDDGGRDVISWMFRPVSGGGTSRASERAVGEAGAEERAGGGSRT